MRGMCNRPTRAKSVLLKSSWAVVIEWVDSGGVGFDRCITLLSLSNRRTWLRWYVHPPFAGGYLPSAPFHQWYVRAKKPNICKGDSNVKPLQIAGFCIIIIV